MSNHILSNYQFSGPFKISLGFTKKIPAIYAILDDKLRVLDVGQTEDLNNRFPNHPRENCWANNKIGNIYLYIHQDQSEQSRLYKEKVIRNQYSPACGER